MGRFKTENFYFKAENGDVVEFKSAINVYANGFFYMDFPCDIQDMLLKAGIRYERIEESTFEKLKEEAHKRFRDYFSKELVESKILIKYQIATSCSYWKSREGSIFPNGGYERERDAMIGVPSSHDSDWHGWQETIVESNAASPKPYGFQIFTIAVKREIFKYKSGNTWVKDTKINSQDAAELGDEPLLFLTSIVANTTVSYGIGMQEIEYSTEVGMFFVSLYRSIFDINEKVRDFTTPEKIKQIAQERFLLLEPETVTL